MESAGTAPTLKEAGPAVALVPAREVVGAGTAVLVEEGLVALQGLDAGPLVPAGDPWREAPTRFPWVRSVVPVLEKL